MKEMTKKSLQDAFAGESQAHMKYLAFSDAAEKEGFPKIAKLFRAISYAEQVHAVNHARNLGYVNKTAENLQSAMDGENFEVDEMYPAYDAIAKLQSEKGAEKSIQYAIKAEEIHAKMYQDAKTKVLKGSDIDADEVYICPVCGFTHINSAGLPDYCPVCKTSKEKYVKF